MSYTNVTIPNLYASYREYSKRIKAMEVELKIAQDTVRELEGILTNIPDAVKDYGYVQIENEMIN